MRHDLRDALAGRVEARG